MIVNESKPNGVIIGRVIEENSAAKTFRLMLAYPVSSRCVNGSEAKLVSVSLPSPEKPRDATKYDQVLNRMPIEEAIHAKFVTTNSSHDKFTERNLWMRVLYNYQTFTPSTITFQV